MHAGGWSHRLTAALLHGLDAQMIMLLAIIVLVGLSIEQGCADQWQFQMQLTQCQFYARPSNSQQPMSAQMRHVHQGQCLS